MVQLAQSRLWTRESARRVSLQAGGEDIDLAVVGLRLRSEHEDECFCTVQLISTKAQGLQQQIEACLQKLKKTKGDRLVGKASVPDHIHFDAVPRNFKGAIKVARCALVPPRRSRHHSSATPVLTSCRPRHQYWPRSPASACARCRCCGKTRWASARGGTREVHRWQPPLPPR